MKKILIFGAGGSGREIFNLIQEINLYKNPSTKSETVTQMIYGDSFSVFKKSKKWLKIKIKEDNYKGYLKNKNFPSYCKPTHKVKSLKANVYENYNVKNNITSNKMTKYEYTKILGLRAQQITMGSNPLITITPDMKNAVEVAEQELRQRKTPYIVARKINSKKTDFWKIEDMVIDVI